MDLREELKSAGVYPTGPVSAWPEHRNQELAGLLPKPEAIKGQHARSVKASPMRMARGLASAAKAAATSGKVSKKCRDKRYEICKLCPAFIPESKRCSECGCFMELKTWINGDKDQLCPLQKWET